MTNTTKNIFLVVLVSLFSACGLFPSNDYHWSTTELNTLKSLWLHELPALAPDPSNRYGDNLAARQFGKQLFFDSRLSDNGQISCASCHQLEKYFSDGLAVSKGIDSVTRNAPSIIGTAYSPWLYWDGRRDSLWSQALTPIETPAEHGFDRKRVINLIKTDKSYRNRYEKIFGPLPKSKASIEKTNQAFANVGKAIAAFERTLLPNAARFDAYLDEIFKSIPQAKPLSNDELAGLKLFISDEAQCTRCHNGPLLTNFGFHNIGLVELKRGITQYDFGRVQGIPKLQQDPFNCLGRFSDAKPAQCTELNYIKTQGIELGGAFKVPSLRNVAMTAPYMHDGRFATLSDVLAHYLVAPFGRAGHQELNPLAFSPAQLNQIEAFLNTLTGPAPGQENK